MKKRRNRPRRSEEQSPEKLADLGSLQTVRSVIVGSPDAICTTIIHASCNGEWREAEDLRSELAAQIGNSPESDGSSPSQLTTSQRKCDLTIDLSGLNHLDGSALQVLLAVESEQRLRGGRLAFVNLEGGLERWFAFAGASGLLERNVADFGQGSSADKEHFQCAKC